MDVPQFCGSLAKRRYAPLLALALMTLGTTPAHASRIHHLSYARQQAQLQQIQTFLNGGEVVWSATRPPIFPRSVLSEAATEIAAGNETTLVQYLHWRRDLNPSRFDHYHPYLGPLLANDTKITTPSLLPTPTVNPTTPGTTPTSATQTTSTPTNTVTPAKVVSPQSTTPPRVPEPSTTLIAIALIGAFALKMRRTPPI